MVSALALSFLLTGCSQPSSSPDESDLQRYVQENPGAVASSSEPPVTTDPRDGQ